MIRSSSLPWMLLLAAMIATPASRVALAHESGTVFMLSRTLPATPGPPLWAGNRENHVVLQTSPSVLRSLDPRTGLVRWQIDRGAVPLRHVHPGPRTLALTALDLEIIQLRDGTREWSYPLGCREDGVCQLTPVHVDSERAVVLGFDETPDSVMLLNLRGRRQAWPSFTALETIGRVDVDPELILAGDREGERLSAISTSMGRVLWTVALPESRPGETVARLWRAGGHVYALRVPPEDRRQSRVDIFKQDDGEWLRALRGPICSQGPDGCEVIPAAESLIVYDSAAARSDETAHITVHNLASGRTLLDEQTRLASVPLVLGGHMLVLPRAQNGRVRLEARALPNGEVVWSRALTVTAPEVLLLPSAQVIYLVERATPRMYSLSVVDGEILALGALDLPGDEIAGETIHGMWPSDNGLILATTDTVALVEERPATIFHERLKEALAQRDSTVAGGFEDLVRPVIGEIHAADRVHALLVAHAALSATHLLAQGDDPRAEIARLVRLLERIPPTAGSLFATAARHCHALVVDWLLPATTEQSAMLRQPLLTLAEHHGSQLTSLGDALTTLSREERAVTSALGFELLDALVRLEEHEAGATLLRRLLRAPLEVTVSALPPAARAIVAHELAAAADRARSQARAGDPEEALAILKAALEREEAEAVLATGDPLRQELAKLARGERRLTPRSIHAVAGRGYREWSARARNPDEHELVECFEACQRRFRSCVRPCVAREACNAANLNCVDTCERTGQLSWQRPPTTVDVSAPEFLQCL